LAGAIALIVLVGDAFCWCSLTIALTPEPVLAAIVIYGVSHSLRLAVFRPLFSLAPGPAGGDRIARGSRWLCLGILDGLLAGVAIS